MNQPATCRRCSANSPFFVLDVEQQSRCLGVKIRYASQAQVGP